MKNDKSPKNKNVVWISDLGLSMALVSKNHKLYKTFFDTSSNRLEWLFNVTPRLQADIEKYNMRKLNVNAYQYKFLLIGTR